MKIYLFVYTDTYCGEANYSWVSRFKVHANTLRGALRKVSKEIGAQGRLKPAYEGCWGILGSCTRLFGSEWGAEFVDMGSLKELT